MKLLIHLETSMVQSHVTNPLPEPILTKFYVYVAQLRANVLTKSL